jgi:hypothetical protein
MCITPFVSAPKESGSRQCPESSPGKRGRMRTMRSCEPGAATPFPDHKTTRTFPSASPSEILRIGPLVFVGNPTNGDLRNKHWPHLPGHNMKQPGAHVGH